MAGSGKRINAWLSLWPPFCRPRRWPPAVLALWRIAADLNWTNSFAISSGIFSHWQVWLGAAVALQLCARALNRYGKSGDPAAS